MVKEGGHMERRHVLGLGIIALAALVMAAQPVQAFARGHDEGRREDSHHGDSRARHYPEHGRNAFWLPRNSISISVGGIGFYYGEGVFYRRSGPRYIVVDPPFGAVVTVLPSDCQVIPINGATYYVSQGVYYTHVPTGYVVVPQPATLVQAPQGPDVFTVDVPTYRGGFTKVIIRRSGDGFIGPMGEYYADFPSLQQLQNLYGRR